MKGLTTIVYGGVVVDLNKIEAALHHLRCGSVRKARAVFRDDKQFRTFLYILAAASDMYSISAVVKAPNKAAMREARANYMEGICRRKSTKSDK